MKFLVTGGAGYIGSHMVKYLQEKNFNVDVIDNFSTGNKWSVKECNVYAIDLLDITALHKILSRNNYDAVFHFAAKSIFSDSFIHEQEYLNNNVTASNNLLEGMIKYDINNIIFSSSASVFGSSNVLKINETHPKHPISPYGKTKLKFEKILKDKSKDFNINSVILRYFNAAGADKGGLIGEFHNPETHLIPCIFNTLINDGEELKIFGNDHGTKDGTCIRDYVHVSDLVHAHYLAFKKLDKDRGCFDFNLGNGNGFSVLEIIEACELITKKKIKYKFVNRRTGDVPKIFTSFELVKKKLLWSPQNSLRSMCESSYKSSRKN